MTDDIPGEKIMNYSWIMHEQVMHIIHEQHMNRSWTWNDPIHEKFMNISRHRGHELLLNISMHIVHEQFRIGSGTWNGPIYEQFKAYSSWTGLFNLDFICLAVNFRPILFTPQLVKIQVITK